ncbi:MAG: class I SAM-dependent methyltransferase [Lachnospiraceae bacterium]|nr:class I SAM-dependent methyltransferase [Lachnospiraceae bacterium]
MAKDIQLSNRMKAVAGMVDAGQRVADVGCDHGYVSIYLVKNGISPSALAMDINEGPLERALANIKSNGLEDKIKTRLSDGLMKYNENEADTLIIAGMGGPLINSILSYDMTLTKSFNNLILSPQSEIEDTRIYLYENGFNIVDEDMVFEDGKYYVIMKCQKMAGFKDALERVHEMFGPRLIEKKHPVLREYLEYERSKHNELLCKLNTQIESVSGDDNGKSLNKVSTENGARIRIENRIKEINQELELINEAFDLMG